MFYEQTFKYKWMKVCYAVAESIKPTNWPEIFLTAATENPAGVRS